MTDLRQLMHQAVDQHPPDLVELTVRARRGGTTLRRRHRLAIASSSLAALVLVAGAAGATALFRAGDDAHGDTVVAGSAGRQRLAAVDAVYNRVFGATGSVIHAEWGQGDAATPETEAATALRAAVTAAVPGIAWDVRGFRTTASTGRPAMVGADLLLAPAIGPSSGHVVMTYEPAAEFGGAAAMETDLGHCHAGMQRCRISRQPDGSWLRAYGLPAGKPAGSPGEVQVVERLVDGVVVSLSSTVPGPLRGVLTAPGALSRNQLIRVISGLDPTA